MTVLEALKLELKHYQEIRDKELTNMYNMAEKDIPYQEAKEWYLNQPGYKKCIELDQKIRILEEVHLEPFDKYDNNIYTLKQFVSMCEGGEFIDYDGFGVYANKKKKMKTDIKVYPSDITSGKYRKDFLHVVWYNR